MKCDHSDPLLRETIKKPEEIIICEKQEILYCGRHALRALCQRLDLFSDGYLAEVARNLAVLEQISRQGQTIQLKEYYDATTGEYDIQILKAALMNVFDIDLIQLHTLEPNPSSMQNVIVLNIKSVQALLLLTSLSIDTKLFFSDRFAKSDVPSAYSFSQYTKATQYTSGKSSECLCRYQMQW